MEKTQIPEKASSFCGREEKKLCEPSRNLSLTYAKPTDKRRSHSKKNHPPKIEEEPNEDEPEENPRDLLAASAEIDLFLDGVANAADVPPEIPKSAVGELAVAVEEIILRLEAEERRPSRLVFRNMGEFSLLDAIDRIAKVAAALAVFPSEAAVMGRTSSVLQRAMAFLEEEFRSILEDGRSGVSLGNGAITEEPIYPPEIIKRLQRIAETMISAGYESECCQGFIIARRGTMATGLTDVGFHKASMDELQKMAWEKLEGEVSAWITAFRQAVTVAFARERGLCEAVFTGHPSVSSGLFSNLARGVIIQLLNFAEVVTGTQRSGEKLFKFLDMYETMRDLTPAIVGLFPAKEGDEEEGSQASSLLQEELKSELSAAKSRIGDAIVGIFSDLEHSIKSDTWRTPVPGGAIHPLTRYVMNYLKYACEYKNTLEQIYQESQTSSCAESTSSTDANHEDVEHTPFARQLIVIMDLLDENLDAKSKLYKDPSLSYIFLMNNGRYIAQKLKEWSEINEMLGATWCRKRSSNLRQYHKNYQRETWGKVLNCLKDEGLQQRGGGTVSKTALKERFKSFNSMFEEIHKTQSTWVVSDEQLQSELRVSVSAVIVPAYRSFLGRYRQLLDGGRQSDKYIKYAPEDLETYIDDLFDAKRKS